MKATYDRIGPGYARHRRPDPRLAAALHEALGAAREIVNVGAGAGSYEPCSMHVVAVEPSEVMMRQRRAGSARLVRALAEALPFPDMSFEAGMAVLTLHHWTDVRRGLAELCRVALRRVVLMFEPKIHNDFWLFREYLPMVGEWLDRQPVPAVAEVASLMSPAITRVVPVPHDCADGFGWAYWRRPRAYLYRQARACISALARFDPAELAPGLARLRRDLASGDWHQAHKDLLDSPAVDGGFRLVISGEPFSPARSASP